ncbi:glycosyltransferase, partial [Providencia stuartii]
MVVEFDKMIQQVIPLGVSDLDISSYFHVAYGIDHHFLYGCGVSIASLLMHNEHTNFSFHVFIDDSISDADLALFRELSDDYNVQITLYIINS